MAVVSPKTERERRDKVVNITLPTSRRNTVTRKHMPSIKKIQSSSNNLLQTATKMRTVQINSNANIMPGHNKNNLKTGFSNVLASM